MSGQPTALQLADALDAHQFDEPHAAAAELRRLYDLAMELQGKIYALEMARSMEQKTAKLKRDALLEALKEIEWSNNSNWQSDRAAIAIKAVEEWK